MYKQGLLNPEFSTQSFNDIGPMIADNKLGMFYGCHWYAGQINGVKGEIPDAEWIPILAPGIDGNPAPVYASVDMNGIYCVLSILLIFTSISCLMFFTKFSIRIQRIHNFQAVAAKPAKSLNCKLQLPCRDNVVNTKNDKMKNLSE